MCQSQLACLCGSAHYQAIRTLNSEEGEYLRGFHSWQGTTETPGVTGRPRVRACVCVRSSATIEKHDTLKLFSMGS